MSDEASTRGEESVIDRLSWLSVVVIIFANIRRAMMTSQTLLAAVVQLSVGKAAQPQIGVVLCRVPWVLRALLAAQQKKELRTTVVEEAVREGVLEVTSCNTVGG